VRELQENNNTLKDELAKLRQENETQAGQVSELRNRSTLSQQNWIKERDELISREAYAREEFDNAKQAMQDWEVLAMNERSLRENLTEKDAELREQLETLKDEYEKAARDRDTNSQTVEGLQKALQEVQTCKSLQVSRRILTNTIQYDDKSSKSLSKPTNRNSTICGNKSKPPKKPPRSPRRPLSPRKRNSIARFPSRKKSKRRTS
jgi:chromosome segregation ATPase